MFFFYGITASFAVSCIKTLSPVINANITVWKKKMQVCVAEI